MCSCSHNIKLFLHRVCNRFELLANFSQAHAKRQYKKIHCYKTLYPWRNQAEFERSLISSIIYNKNGLVAINKPFGIKIHSHDKPGARSKPGEHKIVPYIADSKFTIDDSLAVLKEHLNAPNLSIIRSAEKYTSGIVLLGENENVSGLVRRSVDAAKQKKTPHLIHWMLTLGVAPEKSRKERVGIKFVQEGAGEPKQPVIVFQLSKRLIKRQEVYGVNVEYKTIAENKAVSSSLVEIATSSVRYHFVRVYASTRIVPIMGDILYGSRMNTVQGMPIRLHVQHAQAQDMQPLPKRMSEALGLPHGLYGHTMMPTMLHLRSILLPSFSGEDVIITAPPPFHFQWTAEQLNLLNNCK